ncbi:MAG: ParB/RepB/Spo0J family partition protein [Rickettsiales bacterium]
MKRKASGLGKGLSALFDDAPREPAHDEDGVISTAPDNKNLPNNIVLEISLDLITPGSSQPRKRFDAERISELAASIKENGLIQPIIVSTVEGSDRFSIIAGERRWRACKEAGLGVIKAIVRHDDETRRLETAIIENVQREDLSVVEEAQAYRRLMDEHGYTQEQLAKRMGKSRAHIANTLRLMNLPQQVCDMLEEGLITAGHARALLGAVNPLDLAKETIERKLSVRDLENRVKNYRASPTVARVRETVIRSTVSAREEPKDEEIALLEESLQHTLNKPVEIRYREGKGAIAIGFDSLEELDELIALLEGRSLSAGVHEAFEERREEYV